MEQRRSRLHPRRLEQRDGASGSVGNASAAALAAMAQQQPQTWGAAMAMAQQLQQWFQMMTRTSKYLRQRQAGSATLLALRARGAWRGGGSTQQSNGREVGEVGAANELKNEDWLHAEWRKKWSLVDEMKYGHWRRMHNDKESCYLKRMVHPGG